jgi:transcriptional regulator
MSFARPELLTGTLELLVLKTLSVEPMHGWGIAQRIQAMSRDTFLVQQGSLYPALQRMRRRGWVRPEWRVTENRRRARYYVLTDDGQRELEAQAAAWKQTTVAMDWVLGWQAAQQGAAT